MEEIVKKVTQVLDQFYIENMGDPQTFGVANRLSQFAFLSLKGTILNVLNETKANRANG